MSRSGMGRHSQEGDATVMKEMSRSGMGRHSQEGDITVRKSIHSEGLRAWRLLMEGQRFR